MSVLLLGFLTKAMTGVDGAAPGGKDRRIVDATFEGLGTASDMAAAGAASLDDDDDDDFDVVGATVVAAGA